MFIGNPPDAVSRAAAVVSEWTKTSPSDFAIPGGLLKQVVHGIAEGVKVLKHHGMGVFLADAGVIQPAPPPPPPRRPTSPKVYCSPRQQELPLFSPVINPPPNPFTNASVCHSFCGNRGFDGWGVDIFGKDRFGHLQSSIGCSSGDDGRNKFLSINSRYFGDYSTSVFVGGKMVRISVSVSDFFGSVTVSVNGRSYFGSMLSTTGLSNSYGSMHMVAMSLANEIARDIGGVAVKCVRPLKSFDSVAFCMSNVRYVSSTLSNPLPTIFGFLDTESLLRCVAHEISFNVGVANTFPFFSLHFSPDGILYPVLHPLWKGTVVGHVIGHLDYFMKGFVNGGVFSVEFLRDWSKTRICCFTKGYWIP